MSVEASTVQTTRRRRDTGSQRRRVVVDVRFDSVGLLRREDVGAKLLGGFADVLHDLADSGTGGLVAARGLLHVIGT